MTYYIAFRLRREGTVLDANEMYCDEAEARERASALAIDLPVELWQGPRRIVRYEPQGDPERGEAPIDTSAQDEIQPIILATQHGSKKPDLA